MGLAKKLLQTTPCYDRGMSHCCQSGFYHQRARYYDPIYAWKDYAAEADRVRAMLSEHGIADGSRILEAACGTGSYLVSLRQWYETHGFDISDDMIAIARAKLPGVHVWRADMADFTVDQPYDALVCLFSSIAYVYPEDRLRAAASCFARAVRPGGVIIIEPWVSPQDYVSGLRSMRTHDGDDFKMCRITDSKRESRDGTDLAVMDFHWIVLEAGKSQPDCFTERHEVWLCPRELLAQVFENAGFDVRIEPDGLMPKRGLLIGQRR